MHATDIVAYTYQAELLCPACVNARFQAADCLDTEVVLDGIAFNWGIDRHDEHSFDSEEFPKVVFADQINNDSPEAQEFWPECCGNCGEVF